MFKNQNSALARVLRSPQGIIASLVAGSLAGWLLLTKLAGWAADVSDVTAFLRGLWELAATPWIVLAFLAAYIAFLWFGSKRLEAAAKIGDAEDKRIAAASEAAVAKFADDLHVRLDRVDALAELYVLQNEYAELSRNLGVIRSYPGQLEKLEQEKRKQELALPNMTRKEILETDPVGRISSANTSTMIYCRKITEVRQRLGLSSDWQQDTFIDGVRSAKPIWEKAKAAIDPLESRLGSLQEQIDSAKQKAFGPHD